MFIVYNRGVVPLESTFICAYFRFRQPQIISNEVMPGEWQQYARPKRHQEMTEAQKERNYERIRHNRENKKWEQENPKEAAALAIIKNLLTISAIVFFICMALKEC